MTKNPKSAKVDVKVGEAFFMMTIDTGTTINVVDKQTLFQIKRMILKQTYAKAFSCNTSKSVRFLGKFEAVVQTCKRISVATLSVVLRRNKWQPVIAHDSSGPWFD